MIVNTILTVVLCVIAAVVVLGAFVIIAPRYAHWYAVRHPEVRNPEMPEEYWER